MNSGKHDFLLHVLSQAQAKEERLDLVLPKLERMVGEETAKLEKSIAFLQRLDQSFLHNSNEEEEDEEEEYDDSLERELHRLQLKKQALEHEIALNNAKRDEQSRSENARMMRHSQIADEQSSLHLQTIDKDCKLQALTSRTALSELFYISYSSDGIFGTINGLRLGWSPDIGPTNGGGNNPADSLDIHLIEEINAALGFASLMLDSLAQAMNFKFFFWSVDPKGSRSEMVNVKTPSQRLSLYLTPSSTNLWSSWWLWNTSFNAGIKAFASCVDEFAEFLRLSDPSVVLPHRIERSLIDNLPLQFSLTTGERWTKAMKYLLTDLKWLEIFCIRASKRACKERAASVINVTRSDNN